MADSLAQPAQHVGEHLGARRGRALTGMRHAIEFEHRLAVDAAVAIILDQRCAVAAIAGFMQDEVRIDADVQRGGVGPRDGRHFLTALAAGAVMHFRAAFRRHHREMAGLVQQVSGMGELRFIDDQRAMLDLKAWQKRFDDISCPHLQADVTQEDRYLVHHRIGEAVDVHDQAAASAWARSSHRSAGSSRPTDRRIRPDVTPSSARAAGVRIWCVEVSGWVIRLLVSQRYLEMSISFCALPSLIAAFFPPSTSNATTPPPPSIWSRAR